MDGNLTAGTTYYYYKVVAVTKGAGLTFVSEKSAYAKAKAIAAPSAPETVVASASTGKITVIWTACDGATQYNVYRYNGTAYKYIGTTYDVTSYVNSGVTAGTTYYYKIVAVTKDSGLTLVSDFSAYASAKAK